MAILTGVGISKNSDPAMAIDEVYKKAIEPLSGNPPSFLMLLASPTAYDQQKLLDELKKKNSDAAMIGCSTSGEITSDGPSDRSVVLMAIYSDQIEFVTGVGHNIKEDSRKAGIEFAESFNKNGKGEKPKTALILPDGLAGNGADIVRGVLDVFGKDFVLAGGSAGDEYKFKKTFEYFDYKVVSGSVVGVGLYGDFTFGVGVRHGWMPIGTSRKVTKSKSNILQELDGKPAIEIYEDQFGKDKKLIKPDEPFAKLAITYPLGIVLSAKEDEYLIRDPLTVDKDGAITCAAEVPEGSEVYIMIGSQDEAISAAADAAESAVKQLNGKEPKAVILFNCIARKKLLMDKKKEEIDRIQEVFGKDVPIVGFYTYGEQAPLGGEVLTCSFHNETDVLFVLAE